MIYLFLVFYNTIYRSSNRVLHFLLVHFSLLQLTLNTSIRIWCLFVGLRAIQRRRRASSSCHLIYSAVLCAICWLGNLFLLFFVFISPSFLVFIIFLIAPEAYTFAPAYWGLCIVSCNTLISCFLVRDGIEGAWCPLLLICAFITVTYLLSFCFYPLHFGYFWLLDIVRYMSSRRLCTVSLSLNPYLLTSSIISSQYAPVGI